MISRLSLKKISVLCLYLLLLTGCTSHASEPAPEESSALQTKETILSAPQTDNSEPTETEETKSIPVTPDDDAIMEILSQAAQSHNAAGIQIAVVDSGTIVGSYAWGWATVNQEKLTTAHKFRTASISKVILGISSMMMQEEGIVDIDADLGMYWDTTVENPYYPDVPITLRTILTHTSSIEVFSDAYSKSYSSVRSRLSSGFSNLVPGSIDSRYYNNYAFCVLGMTLELAADSRLDDYLQSRLYTPMQMDAAFAPGDIQATELLTTLYRSGGNELCLSVNAQRNINMPDTPAANGVNFAGGFTSSAEDLAKIIVMLVNDGVYEDQQLLQPESIAQMQDYISQPLASSAFQALSLYYAEGLFGREGIYYHPGCAYGAYNIFSYDPSTGDGVVVLTSGADGVEDQYGNYLICIEICNAIYSMLSG